MFKKHHRLFKTANFQFLLASPMSSMLSAFILLRRVFLLKRFQQELQLNAKNEEDLLYMQHGLLVTDAKMARNDKYKHMDPSLLPDRRQNMLKLKNFFFAL